MSDSKKPKPSQPPVLPRTWKATPEPDLNPEPPLADSKKSKAKSTKSKDSSDKPSKRATKTSKPDANDDESPGSKLEETPLLDTYEGRRTVRIIVGSVLSLFALVAVIVLVRTFSPGPASVDPNADKKETRAAFDPKESTEREASAMVENARQADKLGRTPTAIVLLQKVARNYDGTEAAKTAQAALDRDRRNRPLFEVDPVKTPTGPVAPSTSKAGETIANSPNAPSTAASLSGPAAPTPPQPTKPPEIVARALPNGFHAESSSPIHPSGWPSKIVCERDGALMVLVPGGEFLMGRDDGEPSERPSHRVRLSTFYIDEHEVTNRQYQYYLKESGRPLDLVPEPIINDRLDLPAGGLTAREARAYCYWANRRLPTEAQWEMAARSSDGRVSYGAIRDPAKADAARTLEPVMSSPVDRSPYGGFDFGANAWEWTSDYYDSTYYNLLRGLTVDPTGPTQSRIKPAQVTVKGGSKLGLLTWREGLRIDAKLPQVGFRGALPVDLPVVAPGSTSQPGAPAAPPPSAIPF